MVVGPDGKILRAWTCAGENDPPEIEQDDGLVVCLSHDEVCCFRETLGAHKYDHRRQAVFDKTTGADVVHVKSPFGNKTTNS